MLSNKGEIPFCFIPGAIMCGRFYFDPYIDLSKISKSIKPEQLSLFRPGEISPGSLSFCITVSNTQLMNWGYNLFDRKLINTRIESIRDKDIYNHDYKNNKCLIIVSGFYEWDQDKKRYFITRNTTPFYLAAIYQNSSPFSNFSIITKEASQTKEIHQRIPITFDKYSATNYLNNQYTINQLIDLKQELIIKEG